jgi:aldehyde:ferredoxin oxidoreductase
MLIRINMYTKEVTKEILPDEYFFLGGRGLTSKLLMDEVDPNCEPLGPNNKLVIAPGLLGGTVAPCSGRISIGAKSPLTGGIKESNGGGTAAVKLAKLGIRALVIEGQPQEENLFLLKVSHNGVEILPADELKGLGNYETTKTLLGKYGSKSGIISIGPAGERGYSTATIAITDMEGTPCRHCGRGGMGAVMGSKKIKAIVIDDSNASKITYKDEKTFKEISREWAKELVVTRKGMTDYGTAGNLDAINALGSLPTRNFSYGVFEDADKISGVRLREIILKRGGKLSHACHPGCVIRCSNIFTDKKGDVVTSSLEFETIVLLGSNCGISDLDFIAKLDYFCDDFGIDTMELGVTIGVMMEASVLPFGDQTKMMGLIEELKNDTLMGKMMGQGATLTGKVLGVRRVPAVKGQGLAAYDPRGIKGTGVTYATSTMGGDHTAGNCLPGRIGYRQETKDLEFIKTTEGIVELSKDVQTMIVLCDLCGYCFFVGPSPDTVERTAKLINARWGTEITFDKLIELSKQVIQTEIKFNEKAGLPQSINGLPEFFYTERLEPQQHIFDIPKTALENIFTKN